MKENTKIFGFANGNQTSYKLKYNQVEETVVSTVSGKALFDFIWIDGDMLRTIFTDSRCIRWRRYRAGNQKVYCLCR